VSGTGDASPTPRARSAHAGADEVTVAWQGGEPTLLGLDFFRCLIALQIQYARPGQRIVNFLRDE
jgi:uncharacterized protein